jgi:hypothetical protein
MGKSTIGFKITFEKEAGQKTRSSNKEDKNDKVAEKEIGIPLSL